MTTIIPILSSDIIRDSRQDIDDNFDSLNTNKTEIRDLQLQTHEFAPDTGVANVLVASLNPSPGSLVTGLRVVTIPAFTNTGASTINVNGLGAKSIRKNYDGLLDAGDLIANQFVILMYNGVNFEIVGGASASSGSASFWSAMPGSPTRSSNTQFTISDPSNVNNYDKLFSKGVILRWTESGVFKTGMVVSASYSTDVVTVNMVGDALGATFSGLKYCLQMAKKETFIIPGNIGAGTDLAKTWYPECDVYKFSVDARDKTAGTTNPTVVDVNDDGTTIMTTKASIASGSTSDLDNTVDSASTAIAKDSLVTVDVDSVSTTPPIELYVDLFYYPVSWRYRS